MSLLSLPDLIGKRYTRLLVVEYVKTERRKRWWKCVCDCGNVVTASTNLLNTGHTKSCGCYKREILKTKAVTHGATIAGNQKPEYKIWTGIIKRCCNPKAKQFCDYGGRGITICEEWRNDFAAFLRHVGIRPSPLHSIDRIDNDRGYEPGNVRWATRKEQNNNQRRCNLITFNGETLTLAQWSERTGIHRTTIKSRLTRSKWPIEKVLTVTPKIGGNRDISVGDALVEVSGPEANAPPLTLADLQQRLALPPVEETEDESKGKRKK